MHPEDAEQVIRLSSAARIQVYQDLISADRRAAFMDSQSTDLAMLSKKIRQLQNRLNDTSKMTLVAEEDGSVIGYCAATVGENAVYLSNLYVHPKHQGKGAGKLLFAALKKHYPHKSMRLHVVGENARALSLYEKLGFKKIESRPSTYFGLSRILMEASADIDFSL